jgi:flagellar hook assembly protein FlgD
VNARPTVTELALHQNRPNPFNPLTTISYSIPIAADAKRVTLSILDISGRLVKTLVDEEQRGGLHEARWDGSDAGGNLVSSGVYFYVLDVGGERRTRKLVLLK